MKNVVARARRAQARWGCRATRERLSVIRRARRLIADRVDDLVAAVDAGRQRGPGESIMAEALPLADACRFLERRAERILAPRRQRAGLPPLGLSGGTLEIRREPYGVVLVIGPSNYPLFLPGVQVLQALVAGNATIVKPGRQGSDAMRALQHILLASGLESDLLGVLDESTDSARSAIASGVDKVVLTGSAATGRAVLEELAPRLVPAAVELSGCDAVFVLESADLNMVARAVAFGLRLNAGATCIAPHRVFVPHGMVDDLEARLVAALRGASCTVDEHVARRALDLVSDALDQGARLLTGRIEPGSIFEPVVLADASPTMRLLQADVFAPVVSLVSVEDEQGALRASVQCPYALGASVFGDEAPARDLARAIRAGVVVINDIIAPTAHPAVPFGGRGESGYGTTRGAEGLIEMTRPKAIVTRRGRWRPHYSQASRADAALARHILRAVHGRGFRQRLEAIAAAVRTAVGRRTRTPGPDGGPDNA